MYILKFQPSTTSNDSPHILFIFASPAVLLFPIVSANQKHHAIKTSSDVSQQDNDHSYRARSTLQKPGKQTAALGDGPVIQTGQIPS